jgi:hypothetical protein
VEASLRALAEEVAAGLSAGTVSVAGYSVAAGVIHGVLYPHGYRGHGGR